VARTPTPSELRAAVLARYAGVAESAEGHFVYPVGRASAERLGYDMERVARLPARAVDRFVGVGNPLRLRPPRPQEFTLDVGCGAGLDTFLAAAMVGPGGRAIGLDLTAAMLPRPRANAVFVAGDAEHLPFADATFDLVTSNGALNLVPDKAAAFREIRRVLRPGGSLAIADLLVVATVPDKELASMDAWST